MRERVYLRGRIYWGWFYERGKPVYRSTKCRDRKAAEAVVRQWERLAADPTYRASHETTLAQALERLLIQRRQRGRACGTLTMYEVKARHLIRLIGAETPLARVDAKSVDAFIDSREAEGAAKSTIGKELTALRGALKIAKRRGEFSGDIAAVLPEEWSSASKPRKRWLTPTEFKALIAELLPDRGALVAYIVATGARLSEAMRARRTDIDRERGRVLIRGTKTAGSEAFVPIVPFAEPLLAFVEQTVGCGSGPMFRPWGAVRRDLASACARLGIAPVTPNDLRRTAGKWLRQLGVVPHLIGGFLRHKDSRMAERVYAELDGGTLGDLLRKQLADQFTAQRRGAVVAEDAPARRERQNGQPAASDPASNTANSVPRVGIEPTTRGFSGLTSKRSYDGRSSSARRRRVA